MTEYPEMEWTCEDHWVQLLTLHKAIYKLDFSPKSMYKCFLSTEKKHNHVLGVGFCSALSPNLYMLKTVTDTLK